jgi:ligand-binding SRPBCC domain-containing protein
MKVYYIKRSQKLPITPQQAWDFFSAPKNLIDITPDRMKFKILSVSGHLKMYSGQMICYRIQLLPLWIVTWVSEITHVDEPRLFVDDQRVGPYALWHHQHRFLEIEGGVEMIDEVHYAIPFGFIGRLANWLFVERKVNAIFDFRFTTLEKRFSKKTLASERKPEQ